MACTFVGLPAPAGAAVTESEEEPQPICCRHSLPSEHGPKRLKVSSFLCLRFFFIFFFFSLFCVFFYTMFYFSRGPRKTGLAGFSPLPAMRSCYSGRKALSRWVIFRQHCTVVAGVCLLAPARPSSRGDARGTHAEAEEKTR